MLNSRMGSGPVARSVSLYVPLMWESQEKLHQNIEIAPGFIYSSLHFLCFIFPWHQNPHAHTAATHPSAQAPAPHCSFLVRNLIKPLASVVRALGLRIWWEVWGLSHTNTHSKYILISWCMQDLIHVGGVSKSNQRPIPDELRETQRSTLSMERWCVAGPRLCFPNHHNAMQSQDIMHRSEPQSHRIGGKKSKGNIEFIIQKPDYDGRSCEKLLWRARSGRIGPRVPQSMVINAEEKHV